MAERHLRPDNATACQPVHHLPDYARRHADNVLGATTQPECDDGAVVAPRRRRHPEGRHSAVVDRCCGHNRWYVAGNVLAMLVGQVRHRQQCLHQRMTRLHTLHTHGGHEAIAGVRLSDARNLWVDERTCCDIFKEVPRLRREHEGGLDAVDDGGVRKEHKGVRTPRRVPGRQLNVHGGVGGLNVSHGAHHPLDKVRVHARPRCRGHLLPRVRRRALRGLEDEVREGAQRFKRLVETLGCAIVVRVVFGRHELYSQRSIREQSTVWCRQQRDALRRGGASNAVVVVVVVVAAAVHVRGVSGHQRRVERGACCRIEPGDGVAGEEGRRRTSGGPRVCCFLVY
eukprot:PhM_4_TR18442/c3_g1_i1/m.72887